MANADTLRAALDQAPKGRRSGGARYTLVRDLDVNVEHFNEVLGFGVSYDMILRRLRVAGVDVATYVVNGFFDSLMNLELMRQIAAVHPDPDAPMVGVGGEPLEPPPAGPHGKRAEVLRALLQDRLAYAQVSVVHTFDDALTQVLSGPMILLVDGDAAVVVVDTRVYPDRNPSTPEINQLMHGPQDGFIENIISNSALIRRRVRDPGIRFELMKIGRRGKTDVSLTYIVGLTDPGLVSEVRRRLKAIDIDGIPAAEGAIAEYMGRNPWNPFPTVRMTERPDVAAVELYAGHVVVLVDTTPVAICLPTTMLQLLQHPEDYHVNPLFGTYLRWMELFGLFVALLLPPLWLLFATHPGLAHGVPALKLIGPKKPTKVALPLQFLLAEVSIDVLRRAILNSPTPLATSFGILGAVVLGDVAVKTGIFSPETLIYVVGAAIASFAIANIELGMATRVVRISLIALEWLWALPGVVIGVLFWMVFAARTQSLGVPYLWPLLPFNWTALRTVLIRQPITVPGRRHPIYRAQDRWRS